MNDDVRAAIIALHDSFPHDGMDRRSFMAELTRLAAARRPPHRLGKRGLRRGPRRSSPPTIRPAHSDAQ